MKLTYDPQYNIAYICFREKRAEVETLQISEELNIDLAPDGTIYGIELLDAKRQLAGEHNGALLVVNEVSGRQSEVPLS